MTDMSKMILIDEGTVKLALETLELFITPNWAGAGVDKANEAHAALREALTSIPDWASEAKEQPAPMIRGDIRDGLVDDEPAHQHIEHCLWARNGNQPCPHVQPAQQQEPVAYAVYHRMGGSKSLHWTEQHSDDGDHNQYQLVPLYTSPPAQRTWVGLTDDERLEVAEIDGADEWFWKVCKAIEAKLKEKNT